MLPTTKREFLAHILTAVVTLVTALAASQSSIFNTEVSQIDVAFGRISLLEAANKELTAKVIEQTKQIISLQLEVKRKYNPENYIGVYIDGIDKPAWVKVYDDEADKFYMLFVNSAYTQTYGITRNRMQGQDDYHYWPEHIAKEYEKNDRKILEFKDFMELNERVHLPDGQEFVRKFWKFYLRLPDGREAVAGIQINE